MQRVVQSWLKDFRGSIGQHQADSEYHLAEAFDFERFFTTQYHLAPNIGTTSGDTVAEVYPLYEWTASAAALSFATHTQSATDHHAYTNGFVAVSVHVYASGLSGSFDVDLLGDGTTVLQTISISPSSGIVDNVIILDSVTTPSSLKVRAKSAFTLGVGG